MDVRLEEQKVEVQERAGGNLDKRGGILFLGGSAFHHLSSPVHALLLSPDLLSGSVYASLTTLGQFQNKLKTVLSCSANDT